MIVVSDATPLISLMKASLLWLLEPLFQEVLIPEAVYRELTTNHKFQEEASQIINCRFIRVVSVNKGIADDLRNASGLDQGESEAIAYASENNADVLLMDEARGRQAAKALNLYVMGTIGVLLFAHEEGLLTRLDVEQALDCLKKANRHIGDDLINYALSKISK